MLARPVFAQRMAGGLSAAVTLVAGAAAPATAAAPSSAGLGHDGCYVIEGRQVFPEGVAADDRYVYATSKADGTIYRGLARGSSLQPFLRGGHDGRITATGIKSTGRRLLVAGAETGRFYVYQASSGTLVATYTVADPGRATFLNDEAVAPSGDVYITDSSRPVIYRIPAAEVNAAPSRAQRILQPAIYLPTDTYTDGVNANGIVATPDGKALLVVYSNSGALYRVDLATGRTRQVHLDRPLLNGDGLLLLGHTLYAARNYDNLIVTVKLSPDQTRGITLTERSYPGADVPTTLAVSRGRLLAVNSQFDTLFNGAPQTSPTFTISSLQLHSSRPAGSTQPLTGIDPNPTSAKEPARWIPPRFGSTPQRLPWRARCQITRSNTGLPGGVLDRHRPGHGQQAGAATDVG
jgi:hypothetical protein